MSITGTNSTEGFPDPELAMADNLKAMGEKSGPGILFGEIVPAVSGADLTKAHARDAIKAETSKRILDVVLH